MVGRVLGRALAGAAAAGSQIINKYIDDDLATKRAQLMADIQRTSSVQQAKDLDAVTNDQGRRERMRQEAVLDAKAASSESLRAKREEASDPELLAADVARTRTVTQAKTDAETEAIKARGGDPLFLKAQQALTRAGHIESAASQAQAALAQFQMGVQRRVMGLRDQLAEAVRSGDEKEEAALRAQIDALDGKGGKKEKFYAVAEKAGLAISAALKSANDPNAEPATREEAMKTVRQQRALMERAALDAGVDLSQAAKVSQEQAHKEAQAAVAAGADVAAVNDRLRGQGYAELAIKDGRPAPAGSAGAKPPKVTKDWLGPGWSFNGQSYRTREEAEAAMAGAAPAPAPAKTNGGSLFERAVQSVSELGTDYSTPEGKQVLQQRVRESQSGGRPLTETERLRAQQLGLMR